MKIIKDDLWNWYEKGWTIVIPSNGRTNDLGEVVFKRGLSFQAKKLFGKLSICVGKLILKHGNKVFLLERQKLIIFPTMHSLRDRKSDMELMRQSCEQLVIYMKQFPEMKVAMPKIGCGAGKMEWKNVAPLIQEFFGAFSSKRFCIVDNEQGDANQDWRGQNKENLRGIHATEEEVGLKDPDNA